MKIVANQVLHTEDKKPIVYDLYYNDTETPKPVVIFCHGYKGFKDWGAWYLVAEAFAKAGFFFLKFNFSHNGGTVEQPIDFPDLEAFAQNNYSKELEDLQRVINFVTTKNSFTSQLDRNNISLIGHSRGGGIVLINAEENPNIKNVITWAGVSDYKGRFNEGTNEFDQWEKTGRSFVENGRTKQQMPLDFQFYKDFKSNEERLTIKRAVKNLKPPLLIIHGSEDPTVSQEEAKTVNQWNPKSKLKIIAGANHVFGASHPWKENTMPQELQEVVSNSIEFLK